MFGIVYTVYTHASHLYGEQINMCSEGYCTWFVYLSICLLLDISLLFVPQTNSLIQRCMKVESLS